MLESVWENAANKHVRRTYNVGEKILGKDFYNVLSDEQASTKKQFFEPPATAKGPQFLGYTIYKLFSILYYIPDVLSSI